MLPTITCGQNTAGAYGTRPLSRSFHDKMVLESLLNQFKSENSFLGRGTHILTNSYISVELMKACVVLDMFKIFIRSGKSVVQLLKVRCFIIIILVFSSALLVAFALQCSKIVFVFHAGLFVSSCSIFCQI